MRTWTRLDTVEHCGGCGQRVAAQEPICLLAIPGVSRPKLRCQACVGPPDDALAQRDSEIAELRQADLAAPPAARQAAPRRPMRASADWLNDWERDKEP